MIHPDRRSIERKNPLLPAQRLRTGVQIAFFALVTLLSVAKVLIENGVALPFIGEVSLHTICPFGGVVSIYQLITSGTFVQKIHESALVLMALVFVLAILFGPVFCGWFCPLGSLQEWIGKLGRKFLGKRFNHVVPPKIDRVLRYLRYAVLGMVVIMTARTAELVFQNVDPYYALFNFYSGEVALPALIVLFAVVLASFFVERPFCKYACPYGALLGLTNLFRVFGIRRKASSCIHCKACDRACPMNITVSTSGVVRNPQCISCMKCTSESACPVPDTVTLSSKGEK